MNTAPESDESKVIKFKVQLHCASCKWYTRQAVAQGVCRGRPPQVTLMPSMNGNMMQLGTAWPAVKADDYCGLHVFEIKEEASHEGA